MLENVMKYPISRKSDSESISVIESTPKFKQLAMLTKCGRHSSPRSFILRTDGHTDTHRRVITIRAPPL